MRKASDLTKTRHSVEALYSIEEVAALHAATTLAHLVQISQVCPRDKLLVDTRRVQEHLLNQLLGLRHQEVEVLREEPLQEQVRHLGRVLIHKVTQ